MANGEDSPGDALADKFREQFAKDAREEDRALMQLEVRAEKRSYGEEEISQVIHQEALERQRKKESDPPSRRGPWFILTIPLRLDTWPKVAGFAIAAALMAFLVMKLARVF